MVSLTKPMSALMALGLCFFGSLVLAAWLSPHPYDWRHGVMSSLASPRDNPHAYPIACVGLATSGVILLPFAGVLRNRLGPFAPQLALWAGRFLQLAAVSMTLSALFVPGHYRVLGIGRMHEHLAQISGAAFCLSLLLYFSAVFRLPRSSLALRVWAIALVLLPVTAFAVSRLSLWFSYYLLSREGFEAVKASLLSSLALWEWIGAGCVYFFLALLSLGTYSPAVSNSSEVSSSR